MNRRPDLIIKLRLHRPTLILCQYTRWTIEWLRQPVQPTGENRAELFFHAFQSDTRWCPAFAYTLLQEHNRLINDARNFAQTRKIVFKVPH